MVVLALSKLIPFFNLERMRPMIDKFCDMNICTVFHETNLDELAALCLAVRS